MIRLSARLRPLPLTSCLPGRSYASRRSVPGARRKGVDLSDFLEQTARKHESKPAGRSKGSKGSHQVAKKASAKAERNGKRAVKKQEPLPDAQYSSTKLGKEAVKEEKKAIIDIYNYAASQGLIPETEMVEVRNPRQKGSKRFATVNIRIPEQGLDASSTLRELLEAEVNAAVSLKRQAEEYQLQHAGLITPPPGFELLTTETVSEFFHWQKATNRRIKFEVASERVRICGYEKHRAWVTANGEPVVSEKHRVIASNFKETEKLAYLVAAIHLCRQDPEVLANFKKSLAGGNGSFVAKASPLDLTIDSRMFSVMREAIQRTRMTETPEMEEATVATGAQQRDRAWQRNALSPELFDRVSQALATRLQEYSQDPKLQALRDQRQSLPMNQHQDGVLKMIDDSLFSIVVGATGSGKTTQVPQILLDDAIKRGQGAGCNIICTQPRRIAAVSVAQRVAAERNQQIGQSIGYHVRFDRKVPTPGGSVNFCTTGILLEQLKRHPDEVLDSISHLVIDEVHERDLNIDFLMIILKKAVKARRAAGKPVPKVVLMSATLDTELFANYFNRSEEPGVVDPCPSISVPGRTFPVKENFLWPIMEELERNYANEFRSLLRDRKCQDYINAEKTLRRTEGGEDSAEESVIDWKRRPILKSQDAEIVDEQTEALVPVPLVVATLAHICRTSDEGAILVFLPGLPEIQETEKMLSQQNVFGVDFRDTSKFIISTLHSSTSKEGQAAVFDPVPRGSRKIILSTNIAETSVTIPDVQYVVDSGKHREKRYDQLRRISKLQCTWISKSNSKQRAGRAGRVQNGNYYALFSRQRFESLRAVGLPELLRSDLQETCLVTKLHTGPDSSIAEFLGQAIEPPSANAVEAAVKNLQDLEALTKHEELTPLGDLLSKLPVHPTLGKLVVLGVIFRCFDPILILCAASGERSLLTEPADKKTIARLAHREFRSGQMSDQVTILNAFNRLRDIQNTRGQQSAWQHAMEKFLHFGAFNNISNTAKQIADILMETGLLPQNRSLRGSRFGHPDLNENSDNLELVRALLIAGYHPNLAMKKKGSGANILRSATHHTLIMGLNSVNREQRTGSKTDNKPEKYSSPLYTFGTLAESSKSLFIRDTTLVTPLMSIFFGGKVTKSGGNILELDSWLPFFVRNRDGRLASPTADIIMAFKDSLDRTMRDAFKSLSTLEKRGSLVHDDFREIFVRSLVAVLELEASPHERSSRYESSEGSFNVARPIRQYSFTPGDGQQSYNRDSAPRRDSKEPMMQYARFGQTTREIPPKDRARPPSQFFQNKPLQTEFAKRYPHLFA